MNAFSFTLILLFGALLAFVFKDLLKELGVKKKETLTYLVIFLALMPFLGCILSPILIAGQIAIAPVEDFYSDPVFLWLSIAILLGGLARVLLDSAIQEQKE